MARRDKHYLGRALGLSIGLHLAVLALQFGVPGRGWPTFGWEWEERLASVPLRTLRATPAQGTSPPALHQPVPPSLTQPQPTKTEKAEMAGQVLIARLRPALATSRPASPSAQVLPTRPRTANPDSRLRKKTKTQKGPAILSLARDTPEPVWSVAPPATVKQEKAPEQDVPTTAGTASADTKAPPVAPAPPAAEEIRATAEARALEENRQAHMAQIAAEQARQREKEQQEAQARAEQEQRQRAARAQAEQEALQMQKAAEEAARSAQAAAALLRQRAEAQAEEQRRHAQDLQDRERQRREAEARALEEKRQAAEAARLAEEKRREEAQREAVRRAEQQRQEQLAAEARAQAQARAAEEARETQRQQEERARQALERARAATVTPSAIPARSGASLASQALDMARRSTNALPFKPPIDKALPTEPTQRTSFLGRNPSEIQLSFYGDSWEDKIRRISNTNYPHVPRDSTYGPVVIAARIRSDGVLLSLSILKSSGNRLLDDAVRQIIERGSPFAAFPPDLRRSYDILEIRRTLSFPERPPLLISQ